MTSAANPPPLSLPKFTFLCGPQSPAKNLLAAAISERDPGLMLCDFESPLRDATVSLFFGGDILGHDLTDENERRKFLPCSLSWQEASGGKISTADFLKGLGEFLESTHGPGVLGRIAFKSYLDDGCDTVFDRAIFRDAFAAADIVPFATRFGSDACLCINLGPLTHNFTLPMAGVKCIWIAVPELDKQMAQLERELSTTASAK